MLRFTAKIAMHRLGIIHAVRAFKRRGCRILVYHRFGANHSLLAKQCEHIRRYFQPVSLRLVAESLRTGSPLPDHAVVVTIDDGYRDFMFHGQPVFAQYEIPVTVFLITGFIDGELWPWWDQLTYMFRRTQHTEVPFAGRVLRTDGDLLRVIDSVAKILKTLPNPEIFAAIHELQQRLAVQLPEQVPSEYEPLNWDEVRKLSTIGVEFGCHTRTHPILSRVAGLDQLSAEIAGSKRRLDLQLGFPSLHFAYPNGTRADYDDRAVAAVKQCGFASAVTVERALNYARADPLRLSRLDADPSLPEEHFVETLAG
jgi:peptidoglycan/xylan/chitin deacetylase (PgdA/CDA1 family)